MEQTNKLYRTVNDKVIAGVAGGLAEYFDVDVVIFRLIFVLLVLFGGGGVLAYIIMWIVIPPKPVSLYRPSSASGGSSGATSSENPAHTGENTTDKKKGTSNGSLIAGIILIVMGVLFLVNRLMPWVDLGNFWPILLIIGGFLVIDPNILKSSKNKKQ